MAADEFVHIPAGYLHLKECRFDFNPEHPPLIKILAGLPLLYLKPAIPEYWRHVDNWNDSLPVLLPYRLPDELRPSSLTRTRNTENTSGLESMP